MKIHLVLCPGIGAKNKIEVDGHRLENITSTVSLEAAAGGLPEIKLKVFAEECIIDAEGVVRLNTTSIPDDLAWEMYVTLRERFV